MESDLFRDRLMDWAARFRCVVLRGGHEWMPLMFGERECFECGRIEL